MRAIPPEVLLSWPIPNYTNPVTRGNALVVVNAIFITLVVLVVALRLYTRIWIKRWFGADDYFILLALFFTIGLTAVVLLANQDYGWDRHVYDIPFNKFAPTLQVAMVAKVVFTAAATFTRLSLLFFYYRLVHESTKSRFRWAVHFNVALSVAIFITFIFVAIFLCSPVKNYWTLGAPPDTCLNEGTATLISGIINCVADFLCTVTPIPMVMKLQMPRRQRIAVVVLFSLGFVVTIAGIVRTWFIYKSLIAEYDITWYAYPLWIAAAVEIDLGVICASAPVLRPLLAKIPGKLSSLSSSVSRSAKHSKSMPSGSTLQGSNIRNSKSILGSATRSQAPNALQEIDIEGQRFELTTLKGGGPSKRISGGSQEAILITNGEGHNKDTTWYEAPPTATTDMNNRGMTPTPDEDFHQELQPVSTQSSDVIEPIPPPEGSEEFKYMRHDRSASGSGHIASGH